MFSFVGMIFNKLIVFLIIPLILSIGIAPALPFANAGVSDVFDCRDGQTLVRNLQHGYLKCMEDSKADTFVRLGLVEYVTEESEEAMEAVEESQGIPEPVMEEPIIEEPVMEEETGIILPPYPNQPEVHPNLIAANDYWSPPQVHKVTDGVYVAVGYDAANSIMIVGDDGIIIVDTLSTYEDAKEVIAEFRKITDKPVKAIIYTHGHLDHVHGTGAFLEEGEDIEIYAHESHLDFYINENSVLGPIASDRSALVGGAFLPAEGPDRFNLGIFPPMVPGTIAYVLPTQTFSDELEVEISGVKLKMVFVAGESSDQIYVWLPDKEVLLIGDNIYAIIPNVYTLRGSVYRDPMNYVNALDKVIPLDAEYLVPSHVKPVTGKEEIKDILVSTRDAAQYIYDQTIRGMNQGYTADELSHMIKLPENLDNHPWLTKTRNQVSSHVKQIYYGNLGWFEGDPAFLTPISLKERSQKIVDGFGGVDEIISDMRTAINNNEYEWAAELGTYALNVDSENEEAKLLKAMALRVLGQRSDSFDIRHWSITEALVLEGKLTITPGAFTQSSPEQMAQLPIDKLLKAYPTKLDPDKAAGLDQKLIVYFTDVNEGYTLHVRNSILAVTTAPEIETGMIITLDSGVFKQIVGGQTTLLDEIEAGTIEYVGDADALAEFIGLFDKLTVEPSIG